MSKSIINQPNPYILLDSIRSIGYSFEAALCDVIDNSISAGANEINIFRSITSDYLFVEILDNGEGMDYEQLFEAMRYGKDKSLQRSPNDLGRFGLGLKSASLSQCKTLTVISKKNNMINALQWDTDHVKEEKAWSIIQLEKEEYSLLPNFSKLQSLDHGTLVIWNNFDVLEKSAGTNLYNYLVEKMDEAEMHLRLVYHRFMDHNYSKPHQKIAFYMNKRDLHPLDPFLIYKSRTSQESPAIINERDSFGVTQKITCQSFILPFQKDLDEHDQEMMGGLDNMARMQGFYIYRNFRLISFGSWYGMRPSNELAKYARIMVDIPSALDDKWGIDVKKEKSTLPNEVKRQLKKTVATACQGSHNRIHKRTSIEKDDTNSLWVISHDRENRKLFTVNKESPLISKFKNTLSNEQIEDLDFILNSLSATLSYIDIYASYASCKESNNIEILSSQEHLTLIQAKRMVEHFVSEGQSLSDAITLTCSISPFSSISNFKELLKKEF